ncbi:MAG: hypothetical protein IPG76_18070 [Acidobacteria bacterium]|nr:hypothetical protein [Acidobacteriota bacterium]
MKKTLLWICCLTACIAIAVRPAASSQISTATAIINANIIDGIGNQPILNATVMIKDGKISGITANSRSVPAGASVIDLKGYWLLPGFCRCAHAYCRYAFGKGGSHLGGYYCPQPRNSIFCG